MKKCRIVIVRFKSFYYFITGIRDLLGLDEDYWGRDLSLPDHDPYAIYLLHKLPTGTKTDQLTFQELVKKDPCLRKYYMEERKSDM